MPSPPSLRRRRAATVTAERRWTDWVKNINAALGYAPEIPAGLEAELRDYQQEGFA